jgi:hypothetical protein
MKLNTFKMMSTVLLSKAYLIKPTQGISGVNTDATGLGSGKELSHRI